MINIMPKVIKSMEGRRFSKDCVKFPKVGKVNVPVIGTVPVIQLLQKKNIRLVVQL